MILSVEHVISVPNQDVAPEQLWRVSESLHSRWILWRAFKPRKSGFALGISMTVNEAAMSSMSTATRGLKPDEKTQRLRYR